MKKILFILTILLLTVLNISPSSALEPLPPSIPTCFIKGTITTVDTTKENCWYEPTMGGNNCNPAKYLLTLRIQKSSLIQKVERIEKTCEELYPLNSKATITLIKNDTKTTDIFKKGVEIEGTVSEHMFIKGPTFDSYILSTSTNIKLLNNFTIYSQLVFIIIIFVLASLSLMLALKLRTKK